MREGEKVGVMVTSAAHGVLEAVHVSDTRETGFEFRRAGTEYWLVTNCSARHTGLEGKYGEGFFMSAMRQAIGCPTSRTSPGYITFIELLRHGQCQ